MRGGEEDRPCEKHPSQWYIYGYPWLEDELKLKSITSLSVRYCVFSFSLTNMLAVSPLVISDLFNFMSRTFHNVYLYKYWMVNNWKSARLQAFQKSQIILSLFVNFSPIRLQLIIRLGRRGTLTVDSILYDFYKTRTLDYRYPPQYIIKEKLLKCLSLLVIPKKWRNG